MSASSFLAASSRRSDALDLRPRLRAALDKARKLKWPIVVAKLDRLSRDVGSSQA
jgi:DNA invertase Pin-like site-specific DNA recombinase